MIGKAIETHWNGYRFRSRLEARWAVFFDAIGVDWEYEAEGYDLGDGLGWYLPDFVMTDNRGRGPLVEIKPYAPTKTELKKLIAACALQRDGAGSYGALIYGAPGKEAWIGIHKDGFRDGAEGNTPLVEYLRPGVTDGWKGPLWQAGVKAARAARFERARP